MFSCEIPASVWNRFCWRWARRELFFRKKPPRESGPLRVRHDGGQQASAGKEPGEKYETRLFPFANLKKYIRIQGERRSAAPRGHSEFERRPRALRRQGEEGQAEDG